MQKNIGIRRLLLAGVYASKGIRAAARHEAAFRQEAIVACVLVPLALVLDVSSLERIALIGCVVLVMVVELLNSAIETVVDRIGTEFNELSGRAKDMGSGAVLLCLLLACWVWGELVLVDALRAAFSGV